MMLRVGIRRSWRGGRGFKLNPKRFSVQKLRERFVCLFRVLSRWRWRWRFSYLKLKRGKRNFGIDDEMGYLSSNSMQPCRFTSFARSNSFYTEAIADCLDFIKRSSISVDNKQVSSINGVFYYTPQILEQAGVAVLLSNLELSSYSASLLISLLTTFFMLPCIMVAMRLMDVSGRRSLMLCTVPILVFSLLPLVLSSIVKMASVVKAIISTASVMIYLACFVTVFGATLNILCAEIFPTRVRGICITISALTYWLGNIIITYSLPVLLNSVELAGVFSIYAVGCMVSWMFVFLKVPETKGMPLEIISEFFAMGATVLAKTD